MIELVSAERCVGCNICVRVCPRDVFDATENGVPIIARQDDCQTCFMCELYCPVDALYVAPHADELAGVSEALLVADDAMGSFAREMGWRRGKMGGTGGDPTYLIPAGGQPRTHHQKPV